MRSFIFGLVCVALLGLPMPASAQFFDPPPSDWGRLLFKDQSGTVREVPHLYYDATHQRICAGIQPPCGDAYYFDDPNNSPWFVSRGDLTMQLFGGRGADVTQPWANPLGTPWLLMARQAGHFSLVDGCNVLDTQPGDCKGNRNAYILNVAREPTFGYRIGIGHDLLEPTEVLHVGGNLRVDGVLKVNGTPGLTGCVNGVQFSGGVAVGTC